MKTILFIPIFLFFLSCKKEYVSIAKASLVNKTNHSIRILYFRNGIVGQNDTIKLNALESFEIANSNLYGKITSPRFIPKYYGDSVWVIFDNVYKISHYVNSTSSYAPKYYLYGSLRNVNNLDSYRFVSTSTGKHSNRNEHFFEFVEQDYLDAR